MDIDYLPWQSTPIVESGAYWIRLLNRDDKPVMLAHVMRYPDANGKLFIGYAGAIGWHSIDSYTPPSGLVWCGPLLAPPTTSDMLALRIGRDIQAKEAVTKVMEKFSKS